MCADSPGGKDEHRRIDQVGAPCRMQANLQRDRVEHVRQRVQHGPPLQARWWRVVARGEKKQHQQREECQWWVAGGDEDKERGEQQSADDRVSCQEWLRREGAFNAALARIARVSLEVKVVIRRVQEVVVRKEKEGEQDHVTRNKMATQPNCTPEQRHRRIQPEQGSRDLNCLQ